MIIIGITGSIGMGKSTTADMLRQMKIPAHDSDKAVHDLLSKDGDGVYPVGVAFPEAYRKKTNDIDRKVLRKALSDDHAKWDQLEELLHPLVRESQQEFIRENRRKGVDIVALDIPLLFETGAEQILDYTICVTAPAFIQRQRVLSRPGVKEEDFAFRLSRQMPDSEKRARADFIVNTGLGLAHAQREVQQIIGKIRRDKRPENKKGLQP